MGSKMILVEGESCLRVTGIRLPVASNSIEFVRFSVWRTSYNKPSERFETFSFTFRKNTLEVVDFLPALPVLTVPVQVDLERIQCGPVNH